MKISTAKKQVPQSMAGAFPCNVVLHKWVRCPQLPTLSTSILQRLRATSSVCPALKVARIRGHHNLVQLLWKGIEDSTNR
jgi:hypothetical protein